MVSVHKDVVDGKLVIEIEDVLKYVPEDKRVEFSEEFVRRAEEVGIPVERLRKEIENARTFFPSTYAGSSLDTFTKVGTPGVEGVSIGKVYIEFADGKPVRVVFEGDYRSTIAEIYGDNGKEGKLILRNFDGFSVVLGYYGNDPEKLKERAEKILGALFKNGIVPFQVFCTDDGDNVVIRVFTINPDEGDSVVEYGIAKGYPFSQSPDLVEPAKKVLRIIKGTGKVW